MDEHTNPVANFDGAAGPGIFASDSSLMHVRFLQGEELDSQSNIQPLTNHQGDDPNLVQRGVKQQQQQQQQIPPTHNMLKKIDNNEDIAEIYINDILSPRSIINGAADVGVSDAMSAFEFNAIVFVSLICTYELLSRLLPSVYATRRVHNDPMIIDIPRSILPLSWLPTVVKTNWATVRKYGGLDAYFYLRFVRLCVRITSISGIWGMLVLCPVFAHGGDHTGGFYHISMANISQGSWVIWFPTMFMWFMTFFVLFEMNEEYKHYLELRIEYLTEGDINSNPQTRHSLCIEEIPRELRSDTALYRYFDSLFPGKVHSAYAVLNIPDLELTAAKRRRAVRRLEKSIAHFEATGTRVTHVVGRKRLRCFGVETYPIRNFGGRIMPEEDDSRSPQRGERVDSINYYTSQLVVLNETMDEMQKEKKTVAAEGNAPNDATPWISSLIDNAAVAHDAATSRLQSNTHIDGLITGFKARKGLCGLIRQVGWDFLFGGLTLFKRDLDVVLDSVSGSSMSSNGFVTFDDLATAACAARAPLSHDHNNFKASLAPDPRDIRWECAHINDSYSKGREWTANFFLMIGAILWSIPIASIQALATAETLAKVPGFQWMNSLEGGRFNAFVNGYLPVVALLTLITVLPKIFHWVAETFEGRKTLSSINGSILERLFLYQLANIYITVTAGSIWTALGTIIDHPGSGLEILATSLPTVVGYFVTLLVTKTLAGLPLVLLRPAPLCKMIFLKLCFKQSLLTQREINNVHERQQLYSCVDYSDQLLVLVICFTYACISPIILPVGALYFLGSLIVYKKQVLLICNNDNHESGGVMFPAVLRRTLIGLICGQLTLIGYTILREAYYQPLALFPLPAITAIMMRSFTQHYEVPSTQLSLEMAKDLDDNSMVKLQFTEDHYRQPVMAEKRAEPLPYRAERNGVADEVKSAHAFHNLGVFHDDSGKNRMV